jgi:hypothetical protein
MKRILFILAQVCLLVLVSADIARAQNHVQTITVTNGTTTITADGNYNQVLVRENAATPSAAFSITLAGTSTALNYPAGTQFVFYGSFSNGQVLGTITATTSGPFSFVAVEAAGQPSQSVKNTIINGSGGSMVYPGAGVPLSTGSSWGTSYAVGSAANNLPQLNGSGVLLASEIPNPSASTLGGVESLSVVAHNFLTGISTSGVPSQAQPAFTDISGSVTAAQLPNPSASTLGGIESLAATSHQWINAISTSGVPSSTQPGFSDLSGSIAIGQTPLTTNGDLLSVSSGALARVASAGGQDFILQGANAALPAWLAVNSCSGASNALTYSTSSHAFGCNTISGGGLTGATTYAPLYATSATAFSSTSSAGAAGQPFKSGGSGAAPAYASDNTCYASSTSDQITSAGAFATTCSVPSTNLAAGTVIEIYFHGVWTTTSTSSPKLNFEINAGGTTGECPAATTAVALTASQTNGVFDGVCRILITTTGSSGIAIAGGNIQTENGAGGGGLTQGFNNASTVTYNTTTAETVSVQETTAMVSGQTMNLQSLVVRVIP